MNKPVAWINVEKRRLEWANPTLWETPTVVKLDRIPLYTNPAELTDGEIWAIASEIEPVEIQHGVRLSNDLNVLDFARAILRKAQEK